jgi:hypothetical protein
MSVAFAQRFFRMIAGRRYLPYSDFSGVTNATPNTQTLFTHGLVDEKGAPVTPSRVVVTASSATPAGFPYEVAAGHTTTQCDLRATGASVVFRARAFV